MEKAKVLCEIKDAKGRKKISASQLGKGKVHLTVSDGDGRKTILIAPSKWNEIISCSGRADE